MKSPALTFYQSLLAVGAITVFFSNMSHFVFYRGWTVFGTPKLWVIGFVILAAPLIVSQIFTWNLRHWPILLWCIGYVWISLLWFYAASDSEMAWQEIRLRVQTVMLLLSLLFVFANPTALLWARRALAFCVVGGVCINVYELFNPLSFSDSIGRSAGLYLNPNSAALALVVGMVLCLSIVGQRYRGLFILLVIAGVLTTMSRQGTLALCVAVGLSLFWKSVSVKQMAMAGLLALVLVIGLLVPRLDDVISYMDRVGLSRFIEERISWVMDPTMDASPYEDNTHSRLDAAVEGWEKFSQYPFGGHGVGSHLAMAGGNEDKYATVGTHNMYLSYMVDHGILGLLVYPLAILAAAWRSCGEGKHIGISFAMTMLSLGFFSHNILMDTSALPLFALMAAITALSRENAKEQSELQPVAGQPAFIFIRPGGELVSRPS